MEYFKYKYNGVKCKSGVESYEEGGHPCYRVTLPEGVQFAITPAETLTADGNIIWLQSDKGQGIVQSHEFVQFIGGCIENHFKGPDYKKIFLLIAFILFLVAVTLWVVGNNILLPLFGECHEAVIINKHVKHGTSYHTYTLAYEFWLNGKRYTGDSGEDEKFQYRIGSSICIVYLPYFPNTNETVNYFFRGEIKCVCNTE